MPPDFPPSPFFIVRDAVAADVADVIRLKHELAEADGLADMLTATRLDWEHDCFGSEARYRIFVAESADGVIGIAICADRYFPGWNGATVALLDLCVEARFRRRGVGSGLLAHVAGFARSRNSVMVELIVRSGNPAAALYEKLGFVAVPEVRNYLIAGEPLATLARAAPHEDAA